jgi:hypothetical protein
VITIHKATLLVLPPNGTLGDNPLLSVIELPQGANILTVQGGGASDPEGVYLWVRVVTEQPLRPRVFMLVATGQEIPMEYATRPYIGTVQLRRGKLIFHVFGPDQ